MAATSEHCHEVLLVDDYDDTREALAAILRRDGFRVVSAWGAEDALRRFREGSRPCIVLLDLRMPGMDGWGFWRRMQDEPDPAIAGLPVIVISGDVEQRARAREVGIREFLVKPIEPEALLATVRRYCDRAARRRD